MSRFRETDLTPAGRQRRDQILSDVLAVSRRQQMRRRQRRVLLLLIAAVSVLGSGFALKQHFDGLWTVESPESPGETPPVQYAANANEVTARNPLRNVDFEIADEPEIPGVVELVSEVPRRIVLEPISDDMLLAQMDDAGVPFVVHPDGTVRLITLRRVSWRGRGDE